MAAQLELHRKPLSFSEADVKLLENMSLAVQVVRQDLQTKERDVNLQIQELVPTIARSYQSLADLIIKLGSQVDILTAQYEELDKVYHTQTEASKQLIDALHAQVQGIDARVGQIEVRVDQRLSALESALRVQQAATSSAAQAAANAERALRGQADAAWRAFKASMQCK